VALSRSQKRWGPRLRTAGALLMLAGAVGLVDLALPQSGDSLGTLPKSVQLGLAAGVLAVGAAAFWVGRRWR
jgi:hypothetical protein